MPPKIVVKIDAAKLYKSKITEEGGRVLLDITDSMLFKGKTGARYLEIALFETTDSKYGDDFMATQSMPKEAREAGIKGPILGNGRYRKSEQARDEQSRTETHTHMKKPDEDVPF